MATKTGNTRREILMGAAGAAAAASLSHLAGCFPSVGGSWPVCSQLGGGAVDDAGQPGPMTGTSTVVTVQNPDSLDATYKSTAQPQIDAIQGMVDTALSTLAGGADNPWPVLLPNWSPSTRIGLKVNCLNSYLPTSPAVVRAIIQSLITRLGVAPSNITVWDRRLDELTKAGKYSTDDLQGATLLGTVASTTDASGPGYTAPACSLVEGSAPRLSRILTDQTDLTINCPVLKSHGVAGVTAGLKNIYGIIDIPGSYHDNLATALPILYALPQIRNSIKLTIVDALRAVTTGDTSDMWDCAPGRIFASLDTLALDRYAVDLVNQLRAIRQKGPISGPVLGWLDNAYQLGLGTKDYNLIECPSTSGGTNGSQVDGSQSG
jgi:uncharacterized protein (DUF362 family)